MPPPSIVSSSGRHPRGHRSGRRYQRGSASAEPGTVGCLAPIVLIAVLAAVLFPVFAQARDRARETQSMANLREIGIAVAEYQLDKAKLPPTDTMDHFQAALSEYAVGRDLFIEPGTNQPYVLNAKPS